MWTKVNVVSKHVISLTQICECSAVVPEQSLCCLHWTECQLGHSLQSCGLGQVCCFVVVEGGHSWIEVTVKHCCTSALHHLETLLGCTV